MNFATTLRLAALFTNASAFAPGSAPPTPTATLRSSTESAETEAAADPSAAVVAAATTAAAAAKADLVALAKAQNTVVGYYDPLRLAGRSFWEQSDAATIGFLRQAELKHGRVAMAAFVGYCVQANGVRWPFPMRLDGSPWPGGDLGPEAQWDALPADAKWQILAFVGALEILDECNCGDLEARPHYMRGGQPGKFTEFSELPLNLYDPFSLNGKMSDEVKARRLNMEVNNGRLAMIGIFGFLAADAVPGSVPLLADIATPYEGNVMIPFEGQWSLFG